MEMNSLPRWLISITLMPLPCQSTISSAAWRSTASGSMAGPAEKLNARCAMAVTSLLLGRGWCGRRRCRAGRAQAQALGQRVLQRAQPGLHARARIGGQLLAEGALHLGPHGGVLARQRVLHPRHQLLQLVLCEAL